MLAHLRANLTLLVLTVVVCAVLYPLSLLAVGRVALPTTSTGSLVTGPDGKSVGSRLVAQKFTKDEWFRPRPSAVDYNAAGSGGSNLGANNPKLRERVAETLSSRAEKAGVPADAVTASGSGLDPHVTLKNARGQLDRVAGAWATKSGRPAPEVRATVEAVLAEASFEPLAGLAGGETLVNVLEVNLELARRFAAR